MKMNAALLAVALVGVTPFFTTPASALTCGPGPIQINNCPAGPQGETGATGPQGPQGETGATGPQGPQGETGATGPQGEAGPQGPQGETGATGATGTAGLNGTNGTNGVDGVDGKDGLNGKDFDMDEALALSSAMSMPVWLGDSETVRISGGLGFSQSDTAVGATAVVRMDRNVSGFVGGAVSTDGGNWGGKAGVSVGW